MTLFARQYLITLLHLDNHQFTYFSFLIYICVNFIILADFEAGFANFEQMSSSTTNPWGEESASDNAVADSDGTVQMVTVQSSDWADFSNSCPFDDNPPEEGTKTELNQLFESISGDSPKEEPLEH